MSVRLFAINVSNFNGQCFLLVILAVIGCRLHFVSELLNMKMCVCSEIKKNTWNNISATFIILHTFEVKYYVYQVSFGFTGIK